MKYIKDKIKNEKTKYKKSKPKVIKINLSLLVGIIFVILILFSSFAGHKLSIMGTKVLINLVEEVTGEETIDEDSTWKITTVNESEENTEETNTDNYDDEIAVTSSSTEISDYKATDELTDEDKEDEYQKNYQETTDDNDNYLIKTAEWTDKENGEALITIEGSLTIEQETTALYATTLCYGHGLSTSIIVENVLYLLEYYDNVDLLVVCVEDDDLNINMDSVRYTCENTEEDITDYITELRTYNTKTYPHYTSLVSAGVYKYLFGKFVGDKYISEKYLVNDPVAIYVSLDGFLTNGYAGNSSYTSYRTADDTYDKYLTSTYFEFISNYFRG